MSNVLPPNEKKSLRQTIVARLVIVVSLAAIVVGVVGVLALVPAYLSVHVPRAALQAVPRVGESATSTADRETVARFKLLTKELARLTQDRESLSQAFVLLETLRPKGVTLASVYYRSGTNGTLVVSGNVTKRDLVGQYKSALEKTLFFKDVTVPVAALVGTSAGSFTMTVTGTF